MDVFVFVIVIVAISMVGAMGIEYVKAKGRVRPDNKTSGELAEALTRLSRAESEVAKLEARVRVLEKLATDDDTRLANEINQLGAAQPRA